MLYLWSIIIYLILTEGVVNPVCAQFAPPMPGSPPPGPPACISQIVTGPSGRVQICTTCYNPYGPPTTFCS